MIEGRVLSIHVAPGRGEPTVQLSEVRAHAGGGLEGDRYLDRTGTFSRNPNHAVTLIEAEALEALLRETGIDFQPSQSRRNIVTRGVALNHLVGREFTVGDVRLRGMELCEPCRHMEKLAGVKGAREGLIHRGGLRCQILAGGIVRAGDPVRAHPGEPLSGEPKIEPGAGTVPSSARAAAVAPVEAEGDEGAGAHPGILRIEEMQFCFVPAGPFVLGSQGDPMAWEGESPQQTYDIAYPFWIARFPVSNAQFHAFVEEAGYRRPELWPEAAEAGLWKDGFLEHRDAETASVSPINLGPPFNRPDHPAAAVTWYEALAFCRWLSARSRRARSLDDRWDVRLPSEVEWEKAARGGVAIPGACRPATWSEVRDEAPCRLEPNPAPRRRFPWGEEPDPARANYAASGIGATSRIGRFPLGASPYGAEELSGNVWEWTRSLWAGYPYPAGGDGRELRERLSTDEPRALRGGAFNYRESLVRCAVRHIQGPLARYRHIGFRVCLSFANL